MLNARYSKKQLEVTQRILRTIMRRLDLQTKSYKDVSEKKEIIEKFIEELLKKEKEIAEKSKKNIKTTIISNMFGYGPLEPLLMDDEITEIMVNNTKEIYIEKKGKIEKANIVFNSESELINIINRIVSRVGRRIDESSPLVDARLPDGSRVNAIIPPLSVTGPTLTIRKFPKENFTIDHLLSYNSINQNTYDYINESVKNKKNIIIAGGTGSGKTTLLNALVNCIPAGERIITIEDSVEIKTNHPHRISLESRPPNIEGKGAIPIRTLLKNALRMRPDRIIVGEIRGAECLDMLQAMNTGHKGSLTTVHANSTLEALYRIETMALMAKLDIPLEALREQIIQGVDIIMYQERLANGERKIRAIAEINKQDVKQYSLTRIQCI